MNAVRPGVDAVDPTVEVLYAYTDLWDVVKNVEGLRSMIDLGADVIIPVYTAPYATTQMAGQHEVYIMSNELNVAELAPGWVPLSFDVNHMALLEVMLLELIEGRSLKGRGEAITIYLGTRPEDVLAERGLEAEDIRSGLNFLECYVNPDCNVPKAVLDDITSLIEEVKAGEIEIIRDTEIPPALD